MLINFAARRLFTACVFDLSLCLHVWVRMLCTCVCVARRVVSCSSDRRERASDFEYRTLPS